MSRSALPNNALAQLTADHLIASGLDDVFRPPLFNQSPEAHFIALPAVKAELVRRTDEFLRNPSAVGFHKVLKLSIPKTRHTYRQISLIDLEDLFKFTALVFSVGAHIETKRVAVADQVVFSYRFQEALPCLNKHDQFDKFRNRSKVLSDSGAYKIKVVTDIANFYDRINIHRLESVLLEIGCDPAVVGAINKILLHWAGRNSYGLPVGCDASRILAEAALCTIDKKLIQAGVIFIRYVDDYRIFCNSRVDAHKHLGILTELLHGEGLFLNSEKTKFIEASQADDDQAGPVVARDFDKIDDQEKIEVRKLVRVGYRTRISVHYREPGKEAIAELNQIDLAKYGAELAIGDPPEPDLRKFVKAFIYGKSQDVAELMKFTRHHLHMIGYIVSALTKESGRIDAAKRQNLANEFVDLYAELKGLDFYRLCIARLASDSAYYIDKFDDWVSEMPVDVSPIFYREIIMYYMHTFGRDKVRAIEGRLGSVAAPVQRVIIKAIMESSACHDGEKRPWLQTWKTSTYDVIRAAI